MKEFCVDLEIAKELKENGFSQNTHFYYYKDCVDKKYKISDTSRTLNDWISASNCDYSSFIYSTPTSDEISKELRDFPISIICNWKPNLYEVYCDRGDLDEPDCIAIGYEDKKLPNALARTWLYLKKKGYIK